MEGEVHSIDAKVSPEKGKILQQKFIMGLNIQGVHDWDWPA